MCEPVIIMARRAVEGSVSSDEAVRYLANYPVEVSLILLDAQDKLSRLEGRPGELAQAVREELAQYISLFQKALQWAACQV